MFRDRSRRCFALLFLVATISCCLEAQNKPTSLEMVREAHPWEFVDSPGQKAAIFGNEGGSLEAWVYPLKFFKNFHLIFHADKREMPAETLARTVITRPESTTIVYATDNFSVRETIFTPVKEAGAMIALDVDSFTPLEIEAQFEPDVQIAWPASVGGTFFQYDEKQQVFMAGADRRKLFGVFGSPGASVATTPYKTNYSSSQTVSMTLAPPITGKKTLTIAWALSTESVETAMATYSDLNSKSAELMSTSQKYYEDYLAQTTNISVPDPDLQSAYDWSKVAILQGMVESPGLGYGMVAGYRESFNYRAGFNWFFGRDSLWTSLALLKEGDFDNVKAVLNFLTKFQREDGKIAHEIAHLANETDWFKAYPYAYASADATPLYLIVAREYLRTSGDQAWLKENWDHLASAYKFLINTRQGGTWPKNHGVGHGWIEGGALLPIETEFYQAGLSIEAMDAMAELAKIAGNTASATEAQQDGDSLRKKLETDFWSDIAGTLALGIDASGKLIDRTTILVTAPLWWPLVSDEKAQKTIDALASPHITADWGSRMISDEADVYDPSGYHFGAIWPLFTGWASVADYQYHRPLQGYAQLRDNALLAHSGATGRVTEVISGTYFEPISVSCPHQIWSSSMVVSPILRGMFGVDARADGSVTLAPHFPPTWENATISNVHAGAANLSVEFRRNGGALTYSIKNAGTAAAQLTLSPAVSLSAKILRATVDGTLAKLDIQSTSQDRHVPLHLQVAAGQTRSVVIHVKNDFGLEYVSQLPARGSKSEGLRFIKEQWSGSSATFTVSGLNGRSYEVLTGGDAIIQSVDNAEVLKNEGVSRLKISFESGPSETFQTKTVTVHLQSR
jgi:glycogen debranching enzyme